VCFAVGPFRLEVCGQAADGRQAVEKCKQLRPDIVIMNLGMPNLNGLDAARQMLRGERSPTILFLTITDCEQMIREVLRVGAQGYLLKSDAARDLVSAVRRVAESQGVISLAREPPRTRWFPARKERCDQ
jgi:DNA-binding NarL/FixJ family response regulator